MFENFDPDTALSKNSDLDDRHLKEGLEAETKMGATNAAAALGNGRLTVGISPWGELTYFRWPSPSYYDHLRYFTFSNKQGWKSLLKSFFWKSDPVRTNFDAPSKDFQRHGKPFEPYPDIGSKAGVLTDSKKLFWMGQTGWDISRSYVSENSPILETRLGRDEFSMKVRDWTDPKRDVMIRKFKLANGDDGINKFFYHNTFQPSITHPSEKGSMYAQSFDSVGKGFAAVYHPKEDLITHFCPHNPREDEEVRSVLQGGCSPEELDKLFPDGGIFITWGFREGSDELQVGRDESGNRSKSDAPEAGREDARDGVLQGSRSYIGPVDSSICRHVSSSMEEITVITSIADTAEKSVKLTQNSREVNKSTLKRRTNRWWKDVVERIQVPDGLDDVTERVVKRSIMNLILGQDKETGSIVLSPSRQPPYHFDWPRNGAFFDLALDLAGFPKRVDNHLNFYKKTQMDSDWKFNPMWLLGLRSPIYHPRGHWRPNFTGNGKPGHKRMIPFEIDETALIIWDIWRHEKFLPDSEKYQYREKYRPVIEKAAEAMLDHVSRENGRLWKCFEDDDFKPKATLQGKASVLTGLCAATDAGTRWGSRGIKVAKWGNVAKKLRENVLDDIIKGNGLENSGRRGIPWSIWPAPLFEWSENKQGLAIVEELFSEVREKMEGERKGFANLGEEIWTLGIAIREESERRDFLKSCLEEFTYEVTVPGTDCYGGLALKGQLDGRKVYQNRDSIPHLWNGTTAYLASASLNNPEIFEKLSPPRPENIQS